MYRQPLARVPQTVMGMEKNYIKKKLANHGNKALMMTESVSVVNYNVALGVSNDDDVENAITVNDNVRWM